MPVITIDTSRVVSTLRAADSPTWRLQGIDVGPARTLFYLVRDIAMDASGRVAIADGSSGMVFVGFPADSSTWVAYGGLGEGPSELSELQLVDFSESGIRVFDSRRGMLVGFDSTGTAESATELPGSALRVGTQWQYVSGHDVALVPVPVYGTARDSTVRPPWPLLVSRDAGWDTVSFLPGNEQAWAADALLPPPAGAQSYLSATPVGIWFGDNARPEVRRFDTSGGLDLVVEWGPVPTRDPERLAQDFRESETSALTAQFGPPPPDLEEMLDARPSPRASPTFHGLLGSTDGGVWVGPFELGLGSLWNRYRDAGRWLAIARDGSAATHIHLPDRFEPYVAGTDFVVGVRFDDSDVEWIERYELVSR